MPERLKYHYEYIFISDGMTGGRDGYGHGCGHHAGRGHCHDTAGPRNGGRCYRRDYEAAGTKEEKRRALETWLKAVTARSDARKAEIQRRLKGLE